MPNQITHNPEFPDIFLGAVEQAGSFKNDKDEDVAYHYFLLNIALHDIETNSNTVSSCGYESLGFSKGSDGSFKDKRKVKADDMKSIFGVDIPNCDLLAPFRFQPCEVLWTKNGNIKRIRFEKTLMSEELLKSKN